MYAFVAAKMILITRVEGDSFSEARLSDRKEVGLKKLLFFLINKKIAK